MVKCVNLSRIGIHVYAQTCPSSHVTHTCAASGFLCGKFATFVGLAKHLIRSLVLNVSPGKAEVRIIRPLLLAFYLIGENLVTKAHTSMKFILQLR